MTLTIAVLLGIILSMIVLFVLEILPADTIAIILMVVLMIGGFVTPQEGISGLSNPATVTVLALMILSVGLETTGFITMMGNRLKGLLRSREWVTILVLMLIVGSWSAFISTTAVVIVFMRIMVRLSQKMPTNLSKILMPLSFAGILGGSCTLLGTSTNLLVSAIARDYDLPPFGIFEFSHIGLIFFAAALLYMVLIGRHLIPNRKGARETEAPIYSIDKYLTEVVVRPDSPLVGQHIEDIRLFQDEEVDLLEVRRFGQKLSYPDQVDTIQANDIILLQGSVEKIAEIRHRNELFLLNRQWAFEHINYKNGKTVLCEAIVRPGCRFLGRPLVKVAVSRDYNAIPLGIKKTNLHYPWALHDIKIELGDTVLMEVGRDDFDNFYNLSEFVVLQEHEDLAASTNKKYLAAGIMVAVVVLAALKILPILVSALAGCAAMFLTGCLNLSRAYRRVDWSVFFLLAGVIPLGIAMDNTGASQLIATTFVNWLGEVGPRTLIGVLFGFTALLSAIISNNATAILIAPIAVSIASNLGLDPRPLLFTVMFAANTSYISPIGYQTNTLIYGPGGYKFKDFFRVGGLLTLIIWVLAMIFIPMFYF